MLIFRKNSLLARVILLNYINYSRAFELHFNRLHHAKHYKVSGIMSAHTLINNYKVIADDTYHTFLHSKPVFNIKKD